MKWFIRNFQVRYLNGKLRRFSVSSAPRAWPVCQFLPSCMLPWRRRRGPHLRCQHLRWPCCHCSPWCCCCFCASSKRSEGWRGRTGPAQRRGSRREQRGPKNPVCLYRCPKKNASYDPWRGAVSPPLNCWIEASSFLHLAVIFLFCTRIRLNWTSFKAYNMRKMCIIRLPAMLHYQNKYLP